MKYEPRPYQEFGTQQIVELPAVALWEQPGLGKTVATLTAISELMHDRFDINKVLVVAPLRVAETVWTDEAEKWDHLQYLRISRVLGSEKQRLKALATPADIYAINRENLVWLIGHYGKDWPFDMVVIDESSGFKDSQSKRFKALRKTRPLIKRIAELTGTPSPNGYMDIWPQVYLLDRGERLHQTITGYRERYFEPGSRDGHIVYDWKLKDGAKEAIHRKIDDICVSLKSADWLDLKECLSVVHKVRLDERARPQYKQMERDLLLQYDEGTIIAANAAVLSGKLLQMASGAVYDENKKVVEIHEAKLDALEDIIEAANSNPVMVFYWFQHDRDRIQRRFPQARCLESAEDIRDWNAQKVPLLLAHPQSCGHGLNLQYGGSTIVWFSLTWSLEYYEQANGRLTGARQHFEKAVIHHLVAEGTMDEDAMRRLERKGETQDGLMEAVKARIRRVKSGE